MNKRRRVAAKKRRKTRNRLKGKERAARQATPAQPAAAPTGRRGG